MNLKELINKIGATKFKCNISGEEIEGNILKIDITSGSAFVKLDRKIKQTRQEQVLNEFANSDNDYHYEDVEFETDEVWLSY